PYLAVGWLWFLGTLVPVIGIVQVGTQAMADRYAYIPLVGLSIGVVWAARDFVAGWRVPSAAVAAAAAVVIAACAIATTNQVSYWKSNLSLWQHAREVNARNHTVESNLGQAYAAEGKLDEAVAHFTESLSMRPNTPDV